MAGTLREFTMPNPALAKKRERYADVQESLWNKMGVEPVEMIEASSAKRQQMLIALQKKRTEKNSELEKRFEASFALQSRIEKLSEQSQVEENPDQKARLDLEIKKDQKQQEELQNEIQQLEQEVEKSNREYEKAKKDIEQEEKQGGGTAYQSPVASPRKESKVEVATIKKEEVTMTPKQMAVKKTILFAKNILRAGLSYLYEFIGMVSTRLADRDVRSYYAWKEKGSSLAELQSPVETNNVETIGDLIGNNMHLGQNVCAVIYSQYLKILENEKELLPIEAGNGGTTTIRRTTTTDAQGRKTRKKETVTVTPNQPEQEIREPSFRDDLQRQGDLLNTFLSNNDIELQTGGMISDVNKQWVYSILDLTAFQQILSAGSFGAMSLALGQIRRIPGCEKFTMKQLIMSEGVRDIFAIFVAFQYLLSSGGNAYAWRTGSSERGMAKGSPFMVSAGLETRKMLYAQVETAQYWFRNVYEMENPVYTSLKKQKTELNAWFGENPSKSLNGNDWDTIINDAKTRDNKGLKGVEKLYGDIQEPDFKTYIGKKLDLFRIDEILPHIIEKILQYAN